MGISSSYLHVSYKVCKNNHSRYALSELSYIRVNANIKSGTFETVEDVALSTFYAR